MELSVLEKAIDTSKLVSEDQVEPAFDKIVTLIEKHEFLDAASLISGIFTKGYLDIRLVNYFLFGYFTENGAASLASLLPCLSNLLTEYWENLRPLKNREKQVELSLNWMFAHIRRKVEWSEKLAKKGKSDTFWTKSVLKPHPDELEKAAVATENFANALDTLHLKRALKDRVLYVSNWLRSLKEGLENEQAEKEKKEKPKPTKKKAAAPAPVKEVDTTPEISAAPVKPATPKSAPEKEVFCSAPMQLLRKKIALFKNLIKQESYLKAAILARDISDQIDNFDPTYYLPEVFSEHITLLSKSTRPLEGEWGQEQTLAWDCLRKLCKSDLDAFTKW